MIKISDPKTRDRTNKAIVNIRLISSRVKRVHVEEAMQKCGVVVTALDQFRKFVNVNPLENLITDDMTVFKLDVPTLEKMLKASQTADEIYSLLTHARKASYKEEYSQVQILFGNIAEYLAIMSRKG